MTASASAATGQHASALMGQTVVVIGGSLGIGLETARLARAEGAEVILTARDPDRLSRAGLELGARSIAASERFAPEEPCSSWAAPVAAARLKASP